MKDRWFKPGGWTYRPAGWQGMLVAAVLILFCAQVFWAVDRKSHSASDTLYGVFPYWIPALGIYLWMASKKS